MVKINLLRERTVEQPTIKAPVEHKPIQGVLIISVLFIAAVVVGAWYWWNKKSELQKQRDKVADLKKEVERLKEIEIEARKYEALIQAIKDQTDIIEKLKSDQSGPVETMNSLIQSLPQNDPKVWFDRVTQSKDADGGETFHLVGFGYDVTSVVDFYSALNKKQYFSSVELLYYDKNNIPVKFELDCRRAAPKTAEKGGKNG